MFGLYQKTVGSIPSVRKLSIQYTLHGAQQVTASLRAVQSPYAGISYAVQAETVLNADADGHFALTVPLPCRPFATSA